MQSTVTTIEAVEKSVEKYIQLALDNGQCLNCISPAYQKHLEAVLKHLRLRMARGEWRRNHSVVTLGDIAQRAIAQQTADVA